MTDTIHITKVGVAGDHAGYDLKVYLAGKLRDAGYEVMDFGNSTLDPADDFPDYIIPLAQAVADHTVSRGIAICGSGVGASVAANKVNSVRACLITDTFSAHQGVEDDDMNMLCLGGRITGTSLAWEIVTSFLDARFIAAERHVRRLDKVKKIEDSKR